MRLLDLQDDLRPSQPQSQECDLHLKYRGCFWEWVEWLYLPASPFLPKLLHSSERSTNSSDNGPLQDPMYP
jgi:hypothetical protein